MDESTPAERQPGWLLLFCGWLFATTTLTHAVRGTGGGGPPPGPGEVDLATSPPRELRRLPGIGPSRANAIARLRWDRGGVSFALQEIRGIGPRTEERVARWLLEEREGPSQTTIFGE